MYRSGFIFGVVALLMTAMVSALLAWCGPCVGILVGLGAGYLAGVFEKPSSNNATARAGAIAGAVGGAGAIVGQVVGGLLNARFATSPAAQQAVQDMYKSWGLAANDPSIAQGMMIGFYLWPILCSIVDILVMAGFGALGGLLWWQTTGKNSHPPAPSAIG